jgi:PTH1 family peptidyl-tRNA hydrolase
MIKNMIEAINTPESQSPIQKGNFLIAGLGNPGREYEKNRHNAGFMLVNRLASRLGESFKRVEGRSLICKTTYNGERLILIKPQTYMNNSGSAVSTILRYYKVPLENLLVVYDDVDLPLGTLRLRGSGGSAGQKGMQSIIERLGTEEFSRLRIGTGRPPGRKEAADYVLEDFPPDEADLLKETLDRGVEAVLAFIKDGLDKTMTSFNG